MARVGTSRHTSIGEKFSRSNRSASNALTSRSSKKTAGNKTKRKMELRATSRLHDNIARSWETGLARFPCHHVVDFVALNQEKKMGQTKVPRSQ